MRDKPQSCFDSGCLLANNCRHCKKQLSEHRKRRTDALGNYKETEVDECEDGTEFESLSRGFVIGTGNPRTAKYAFVLEAPGREEIGFRLAPVANRAFFADAKSVNDELAIRARDYPNIEERFRKVGAPVVGQSGAQLQYQAWPKAGIARNDVFLDNTIRCLPPKSKNGAAYPTGATKSSAEFCCRQYDRLESFHPDTLVFSLHPAGILREITPLPLQIKDMEKIRDFTTAGRRVIGLLGGKAVQAFARFGSNVTKWRGHYVGLGRDWASTYKDRFVVKAKSSKKARKSEEELEDEYFPSSERMRAKRKAKRTRPSETAVEACKGFKRYRGKRPPKCACGPCWTKFEEQNAQA